MDRYEKALEQARNYYPDNLFLDTIFPELAESEDDRIMKFLKDYTIEMIAGLESDISISVYDGVKGHDPEAEAELEKWKGVRAWLEKQKEQKPAEEELVYRLNGLMQDYIKEGKDEAEKEHRLKCYRLFWDALEDTNFFEQKEQKPNIELIQRSWYIEGYHDREFGQEPKWIIRPGKGGPKYEKNEKYGQPLEQKPAEWSLTDATFIEEIDETLFMAETGRNEVVKNQIERERNFLKSLPERFNLQPKQEWSEEDEAMLENVLGTYKTLEDMLDLSTGQDRDILESMNFERDWLKGRFKFLRSQPHWKPSEEQMEFLKRTVDGYDITCRGQVALESLYDDLKKL